MYFLKPIFTTCFIVLVGFCLAQRRDSLNCIKRIAIVSSGQQGYVLSGHKYEAEIMLAEIDTCEPLTIVVNGKKINTKNGVYEAVSGTEGLHLVRGYIEYPDSNGLAQIPFETQYTVYKGAAMISPDAMNMLYIGLDNPISIIVPGYSQDRIIATMYNGTLTKKSAYSYIANVKTRGDATINVSVRLDDSSVRAVASAKFRVRKLSPPSAQMGTLLNGSSQTIETIKQNATTIYSSLGEGFPIEGIKYTVNKFTIAIAYKDNKGMESVEVIGDKLNDKATELINKMQPGDKIIIDDISVTGPDGERTASPFIVTAK